jgi:sugar lactone lactonase YvrE
MSNRWTGAGRAMRRWIGISAAALLVACGGGGGGAVSQPAAQIPDIPSKPAPPEPVTQPGELAVVAGKPGGSGYVDGAGPMARFDLRSNGGVVADAAGNVYIADGDDRIRRITPEGEVSTLASGVTNGRALATDRHGNFFAVDGKNNLILKIDAAGVVTTYAGSATAGSVDGPAAAARFSSPVGLAVGPDGTVYVGESGNHAIRQISPDGMVSTLAGQPGRAGYADGPGPRALLDSPRSLALDESGNLLVADNGAIRRVDPQGNVVTLLQVPSQVGLGSLAVHNGVVYVSAAVDGRIYMISGAALVPVAGKAPAGYADGMAAQAQFGIFGGGMAFDANGNLYVADAINSAVRKLDPQGNVTTVAGAPGTVGSADGPAATASFSFPDSLAQDGTGNLFVTDYQNQKVRRISQGLVSTFAGTLAGGPYPVFYSPTLLTYPSGLVSDGEGNLAVLESLTLRLHYISSTGDLGTFTSSGGGSAYCYPFCQSGGSQHGALARDASGGYYIGDTHYNVIRRIDASGVASVFAGTPARANTSERPYVMGGAYPQGTYSADGTGPAASFDGPGGLALDAAGNLYVADSANNTIRKITPAGVVSTFAGKAGPAGNADGPAATARFSFPVGLAFDAGGNLFVADQGNSLVRKITTAGVVSTVAGQRGKRGVVPGALPATLNKPFGLLVGKQGELYVTDIAENLVLKITRP